MSEPVYNFSRIELWVQAVLRVPPYPQAPEGSRESIQVFRPGTNYYKICMLGWATSHFMVLIGLVAGLFAISQTINDMPWWVRIVAEAVAAIAILMFGVSMVLSYYSQRLNYLMRWYIVTDRSLRIRTGIVATQELTMTFSNIQEIRVTAGPLLNFLKLADVEVQSAGGGSKDGSGHIGRFKAVSNANAIRDLLVERLRQYRDSGLGEHHAESAPTSVPAIEAAREVLAEARALRRQVASPQ